MNQRSLYFDCKPILALLGIFSSMVFGSSALPQASQNKGSSQELSSSLFKQIQESSVLLPPVDFEEETKRALSSSARKNPFVPLPKKQPLPLPTPTPSKSPKTTKQAKQPGNNPGLQDPKEKKDPKPVPTPPPFNPTPNPTPTLDPAAFADTIAVNGIIKIDHDSFALVSIEGKPLAIVKPGESHEDISITGISAQKQEVILKQGGISVRKPVTGSSNLIQNLE